MLFAHSTLEAVSVKRMTLLPVFSTKVPLLRAVAFQSSSIRYRVNGAIATRWLSFVVPSARGWKSRDILVNRGDLQFKGADQIKGQCGVESIEYSE